MMDDGYTNPEDKGRGHARRDQLRMEGEARNERYRAISLDAKIAGQISGGHDGRQLAKLLKEKGTDFNVNND